MEKRSRKAHSKPLRAIATAHDLLGRLGAQPAPDWVLPDGLSFSRVAIATKGVTQDTLFVRDSVSPTSADAMVRRGVAAFLSRTPVRSADGGALPTFLHDDPRSVLVEILRTRRSEQGAKAIGITGSIGKSTVKNMLARISESRFRTFASPGNANMFGSVVRHIQRLAPDTEVFIQETGAYEPGAVTASSGALDADAFILTGIGFNHVGDYGNDKQALLSDKLSYDQTSKAGAPGFVNLDDPILRDIDFHHPVVWYSVDNPRADYFAQSLVVGDGTLTFEVVESSSSITTPVVLNTHGAHNVQNAVVSFAVGRWLGLSSDEIAQALGKYKGTDTRQNLVKLGSNRVLVDCYNASEGAIASTTDALRTLRPGPGGQRILVLADIDDKLGDFTEEIHRRVGARLSQQDDIDLIAMYGDHMASAADEAERMGLQVFHTTQRSELHDWLKRSVGRSDVVAFKGGQHKSLATSIDQFFGSDFLLSDSEELRRRSHQVSKRGLQYRIVSDYGAVLTGIPAEAHAPMVRSHIEGVPVQMVGPYAMARTHVSLAVIPEPVQTIARGAFYRCRDLTSVVLPETLRFIGEGAFRDCTALERLILPDSVTDIRDRAFKGCVNLREVHLPASIEYLADDAFAGCPNLVVPNPEGQI